MQSPAVCADPVTLIACGVAGDPTLTDVTGFGLVDPPHSPSFCVFLISCLVNSYKNLPLLFESMFCVVMYAVNLGRFILGDEVFKYKNLVPSSLEAP